MSNIDRETVRETVKEVLKELEPYNSKLAEDAAKKAVTETLVTLGIDHTKPVEAQQDFHFLRSWRKSVQGAKKKGTMSVIAAFTTGIVALMIFSIREFFKS